MKLHTPLFEEATDTSTGGGSTLLSGAGDASAAAQQQNNGSDEHGSTSFDFRSLLDDKGGFKQGWESFLPEDLRASSGALTKYHSPLELMRGHTKAARLIGTKNAPLKAPAPDATPEQRAAFDAQIRGVLGIPEKVEDYKLAKPENLPDGITWDEGKAGEFVKLAHSLNVPPAAAAKIVEWQMAHLGDIAQQGQAKLAEWEKGEKATLEKEWGSEYTANLGRAAQFAKIAGFNLDDPKFGNSSDFIKAMFTASQLIKPDAFVGADKSGANLDHSAMAQDIIRNPNNPHYKAYQGLEGPERQQEAAKMVRRLQGHNV